MNIGKQVRVIIVEQESLAISTPDDASTPKEVVPGLRVTKRHSTREDRTEQQPPTPATTR